MSTNARSLLARVALGAAVALQVACEQETRVIRRNPPLANLPGAISSGPVVGGPVGYADPTRATSGLVTTHADGSKTLHAKTGRHLMAHIYTTIRDDQPELFVTQVLSERARRAYEARGLDPAQAFDDVKGRRADFERLVRAMPQGEFTPGVFLKRVDDKVRRFEVTGKHAEGLAWSGIDMAMEKGEWRLVGFVDGPGAR